MKKDIENFDKVIKTVEENPEGLKDDTIKKLKEITGLLKADAQRKKRLAQLLSDRGNRN